MKRNFSLCQTQIYPTIPFFPNFRNFLLPFVTRLNFNFLTKDKNSKSYSSVNSKNKPSMQRNFSFCHTTNYSNIPFSSNFSEIFIPFFDLSKILIFLQKTKNQAFISLWILKINYQRRGSFFLVILKFTKISHFLTLLWNLLFYSLT